MVVVIKETATGIMVFCKEDEPHTQCERCLEGLGFEHLGKVLNYGDTWQVVVTDGVKRRRLTHLIFSVFSYLKDNGVDMEVDLKYWWPGMEYHEKVAKTG